MDEEVCSNCVEYQPNWQYCPLLDLFRAPNNSCEEFIAKKDEVKDGE